MDDFNTKLEEIIEERVSILFEIERTIFTQRYSLSWKHQDILSKQSISMIYSIWEGFIQKSFNLYIDELNKIDIELHDFCDSIVIHHMENYFKQFKEYPSKDSRKIFFFNSLKEFRTGNNFSIPRTINTESNVGFSVLNKLLGNFSIEKFPQHWKDYSHPNPDLQKSLEFFLQMRNTIAHGGDLTSENKIDQKVYTRFKKLAIDLMYEIRLKMLEALEKKMFLK